MSQINKPWGEYPESLLQKAARSPVKIGLGTGRYWRHLMYKTWCLVGKNTEVDVNYYDVRMRLNATDGLDRKVLFRSGMRDRKEIDFIRKFADQKYSFLDIGSHYGYYTLMALNTDYHCAVAIDPDPNAYHKLMFHLEANGHTDRVRCFMEGASNEPGELHLDLDIASLKDSPSARSISVPVRTLREILSDANCKPINCFKIDVEGHEDRVLIPWFESLDDDSLPHAGVLEFCNSERWENDVIEYMRGRGYVSEFQTRSNICMTKS